MNKSWSQVLSLKMLLWEGFGITDKLLGLVGKRDGFSSAVCSEQSAKDACDSKDDLYIVRPCCWIA